MSLMEAMKERNEMQKLMLERARMFDVSPEEFDFRPLQLRAKKPRVNKILGESNPLAQDDMEALREFIRISRGG